MFVCLFVCLFVFVVVVQICLPAPSGPFSQIKSCHNYHVTGGAVRGVGSGTGGVGGGSVALVMACGGSVWCRW